MTDVDNFLSHYGVLGMRWGVTRDRAESGDKRAIKTLNDADKSWETELNSQAGYLKAHNLMAKKMNNGLIAEFNKVHAKPGVDYRKETPETKAYFDAYEKLAHSVFSDSVMELYGESPSGKKKIVVERDPYSTNPYIRIIDVKVSHFDVQDARITLVTNSMGMIIKFGHIYYPSLSHKEELMPTTADNFLSHYGVKGMKWGRHLPGRGDDPKGSNVHPDHADAHASDRKPISQLSNAEIQRLNQRNQLEKKLAEHRASQNKIKQGEKHVKEILATIAVAGAAGATAAGAFAKLKSSKAGQAAILKATPFVLNLLRRLRILKGVSGLTGTGFRII